ncbi:MAG: glutamate--tRNA ligase, partial [Thermoanaerobacterium sp.]|nr:glutamate--tRNA ligase [Thermoanaerobacterium sp.]
YIGENVDEATYEWLKKVVSLFKDGLHYVAELKDKAKMFFVDDLEYNSEIKDILLSSDAKNVLTGFKEEIENMDEITEDGIKELLKMLQKKIGVKGKAFFMPIRFALTGQDHGPELVMIIPLLGKQKILQRINKALKSIS